MNLKCFIFNFKINWILIQKQYLRLSFRMIDRDYERMKYLDNFFLKFEFNSIEIICIKKNLNTLKI